MIGDILAEVILSEEPAGDERHLHGLEIAGADPAVLGGGTREERTRVGGQGDEVAPAIAFEGKHADDAGGAHAGQVAQAIERALIEGFTLLRLRVLVVRKNDIGSDDVLGGEAAVDAEQAVQAEQEHAGENDQCDAGSDLADDKRAAHPLAAGGFRCSAAFRTQRLLGMAADEADCGQEAAEQCTDERCANGKEDERHIHAQRMQQWQGGGEGVGQQGEGEGSEQDAEQASGGREQKRFCNRAAH